MKRSLIAICNMLISEIRMHNSSIKQGTSKAVLYHGAKIGAYTSALAHLGYQVELKCAEEIGSTEIVAISISHENKRLMELTDFSRTIYGVNFSEKTRGKEWYAEHIVGFLADANIDHLPSIEQLCQLKSSELLTLFIMIQLYLERR